MRITTEQMQPYIQAAKERQAQRAAKLDQHRVHGRRVAMLAAQILKTEFQAKRVVVFGSLISGRFHEASDLDLAVWGLSERRYFAAVAKVLSLRNEN